MASLLNNWRAAEGEARAVAQALLQQNLVMYSTSLAAAALYDAASRLSANLRADSANKECKDDLTKIGVSAEELATAASKLSIEYGPGSRELVADLYKDAAPQVYAAAKHQYGATTIGQAFAKGGTTAMSALGGNKVYIRFDFRHSIWQCISGGANNT
jgi:hypothetical protein